jgi:tetrahydromethanopterin S-methyltransferase subunit G
MSVMTRDDNDGDGGCGKIQESVWLEAETIAAIETRLEYADSKSEWVREAVRQRLARETPDDVAVSAEFVAE